MSQGLRRIVLRAIGASALNVFAGGGAAASPPEVLKYEIVTNGEVNGALEVERTDRSVTMRNRYQSQDKIRELTVRAELDPSGLPVRLERFGQSFAFQPIDEHFARRGGSVNWKNRIENVTRGNGGGRYYVPLGLADAGDSTAYELGLLAAATIHAPGAKLNLLPIGQAQARVVRTNVVEASGKREMVRLIQLTGISLEPEYVWLDAVDQLFAARGAIRSGWRSVLPSLDRDGEAADANEVAKTARETLDRGSSALIFSDVAVFDSPRERTISHRDVLVDGGRIIAVAPHGKIGSAKRNARLIDGRGQTLLPGLWDMHVHLGGPREALRHLASGVTTVRDMGNNNVALKRLIDRISAGELPGPTVIRSGFIEGRSTSATYTGRLVASEAEAVAAVNAYANEGFAQIKLYNAVHPEWVPAIARATHARGLRLSGHIPFGSRADTMIDDGYNEIQHWVFLILNFAPQPVTTGLTFNTARVAKTLDFHSAPFSAFLDRLKQRQIVTDLTLAVYEPLLRGKSGVPSPAFLRTATKLPPAMLRQIAKGPLPTPSDMSDAEFLSTYGKALTLAKLIDERGIQIVAGTDFAPLAGLAFPRELELLVEAGLKPAHVLKIATHDAARVMHKENESGSIETGKIADLILVRGDPSRNIAAVRNVELVVKAGRAFRPRDLIRASGLNSSPQ